MLNRRANRVKISTRDKAVNLTILSLALLTCSLLHNLVLKLKLKSLKFVYGGGRREREKDGFQLML